MSIGIIHYLQSLTYLGFMIGYSKNLEWILKDSHRIWIHIFFWVFIYLDEILSLSGITSYPKVDAWPTFFMFFMDALTVYFNLYVLIGAYLLAGRAWMYFAFTVITIFINIEFGFMLRFNFFEPDLSSLPDQTVLSQLISDFAGTTFMLGTAIAAHMLRRNVRDQKLIQSLETDKLSAELKFLKNQINPHFLFNALNNIYVLTRTEPSKGADSILLLSDLLRYQLYDCAQEEVQLSDEIQYLQNYLSLEKMRRNDGQITFQLEGNTEDIKIAPYLFIPFVENAVKHGSSQENTFFINIEFRIEEKQNKVHFIILNNKGASQKVAKEMHRNKKSGGIGLVNVKRRLELIYPGKYHLGIKDEKNTYTVTLELNLEE